MRWMQRWQRKVGGVGRRSEFERLPRDKYPTPYAAVLPLLPHLDPETRFVEPCAGDGRLIRYLEKHGHICEYAFDIEPDAEDVDHGDALKVRIDEPGLVCITNPPWTRSILHPLIEHWRQQMPTWFLFDANWMFTKQAAPYLPYCREVVAIGRVKWIEDSKHTGKEDSAWFCFHNNEQETVFYGR